MALVTGAGSGIGRATAALFAGLGASVVATDLQAATMPEAVVPLQAQGLWHCNTTSPRRTTGTGSMALRVGKRREPVGPATGRAGHAHSSTTTRPMVERSCASAAASAKRASGTTLWMRGRIWPAV